MDYLCFLLIFVGFILLWKSADVFIDSAVSIAVFFSISELVVGLTIASIGTSFPELITSVYAAYVGSSGIAIGNVVGSNLTNIALVLGICAAFRPFDVGEKVFSRDGPIMVVVSISLLVVAFLLGKLLFFIGLFLLLFFFIYMYLLFRDEAAEGRFPADKRGNFLAKDVLMLFLGGLGIFIGAKLIVDSALEMAFLFGMISSVIGSTIVALGTSLPELFVSVSAVVKKHEGISIGNIIGSNVFNMTLVLGAASVMTPLEFDHPMICWNLPMMIFISSLFLFFIRARSYRLRRWNGIIFLMLYTVFLYGNFSFF